MIVTKWASATVVLKYLFRYLIKSRQEVKTSTLRNPTLIKEKQDGKMDMEMENPHPLELVLKPRVSGKRRGTVGHHTVWMMSKALMDCSSELQELEVHVVDQEEDWSLFARNWTRQVQNNKVALLGLMEDEEGKVGSLTVADLVGNVVMLPIKRILEQATCASLADWIMLALPELHQVLRDASVTKIVSSPHLISSLLRPEEREEMEEMLHPVLDPVQCAVRRSPRSFIPRCEGEACTSGPGFGLKAMVWSYLGEQHGPKEGGQLDQGRRMIRRWPNTQYPEYSREQIVWSLEVLHASKVCVLDYFLHGIHPEEEEQSFVFFGEVFERSK